MWRNSGGEVVVKCWEGGGKAVRRLRDGCGGVVGTLWGSGGEVAVTFWEGGGNVVGTLRNGCGGGVGMVGRSR